MLQGHNLIYFGPEKWDGLWRNRHQLMSRFARHNRVLYVEPKSWLKHMRHQWREGRLGWRDLWQNLRRDRVTRIGDNLYVYHSPTFLPISDRYPVDRVSRLLWSEVLRRNIRTLGIHRPIVWLSRPSMVHLIGAFDEALVVYHVVDEYLSYCKDDGEARMEQQILERQMLEKADLVIVVSERLLQAKRAFNRHTYLVPNGVDYEAYAQALESGDPPPPDIAPLPKPVLGYSGLIADRLNLEVLRSVAATHPEWSLVLVGAVDDRRCAAELRTLEQMANVHFLGRKDVHQVPYYVKAFDVCLVPYQVDERAQNASPLKLYDYLAAGKPIVSTNFSAANQFKDVVLIADSEEEFARCVEKALLEGEDDLRRRRQRIAARHTWENRVNQLSDLIQARLDTGQPRTRRGQSTRRGRQIRLGGKGGI